MADEFTMNDFDRFMTQVFQPHAERMERHMQADEAHFAQIERLVQSIETTVQVSSATNVAVAKQATQFNDNITQLKQSKIAKITACAIVASPIVGACGVIASVIIFILGRATPIGG